MIRPRPRPRGHRRHQRLHHGPHLVRDLLSRHRSRLTQPGAKPLDQHGLAAWQEFNDDYLLDIDRTAAQITVHYPKIDDATARLTELVRTEQSCCAFATWAIDTTHPDLRLSVTGTDDALAALTFLEQTPAPATKESVQ